MSSTNVSRLKDRMRQRKRSHITWASMKVITEIGAFISIVLLIFLIVSTILIVTFMPNDISARFNNGMLFARSINDGYQLALQNMAPSTHPNASNFKQMIAKKIMIFYEFPFEAIRQKMSTKMVQNVFEIVAEIPTIMYDVEDMIWYIDSIIREDAFGAIAPSDYGVQSKRNFPFTITFNDTSSSDALVNGEYICASSVFPEFYWRKHKKVRFVMFHDDYWRLYKVSDAQSSVVETKNAETDYLKVVSAEIYDGQSNQIKNLDPSSNEWNNLFEPFSAAQPFEIRINKFPNSHPQSNGLYTRIGASDEWKSQMFHLFDNVESIQGLTVFIKQSESMLHQLSHFKNGSNHKWTLQSYQIQQLYQSIDPYSKVASIDVVKWTPNAMALAKTKYQSEFESPFIQRVILKYRQRGFDRWNRILCAPYLKISVFALHLKFNVDRGSKRSDHIEARYTNVDINKHECEEDEDLNFAHLAIDNLFIRSQTLGGNVDANVNVFFNGIEACKRWKDLYIHQIKKLEQSNQKTDDKRKIFIKKELEKMPYLKWILDVFEVFK